MTRAAPMAVPPARSSQRAAATNHEVAASAGNVDLSAFDASTAAKIQARMDISRWIIDELDSAVGGQGDFTVSAKLDDVTDPRSAEDVSQLQISRRTRFSPQTLSTAILDGTIDPERSLWRPGAKGWKTLSEALTLPLTRYGEIIEQSEDLFSALGVVARETDETRWPTGIASMHANAAENAGAEDDERIRNIPIPRQC